MLWKITVLSQAKNYGEEQHYLAFLQMSNIWFNRRQLDSHMCFCFVFCDSVFFINLFSLFINFWLCRVFVAARGLSLVAVSRGYSLLRCAGFLLQWLLLWRSTGSRCVGFSSCGTWASVVVARGLSSCGTWAHCSVACGIFPVQGLNLCPLNWQADS